MNGIEHELRRVVHVEFLQNARPMRFNRRDADAEQLRDLLVAASLGDQLEHFTFAFGQRIVPVLLVDPDDVESIVDALDRALTDDSLAARLSGCGVERSRLYNWRYTAQTIRAAFQEAVLERLPSGLG